MSKIVGKCVALIMLSFSSLGHVSAQKESMATLAKPPYCGKQFYDRLFGSKTDIDDFPWTALIEYRKSNGQTGFHCGGSLINSRYVLTAAHCVQALPNGWQAIGVRLGEWDLAKELECDSTNRFCIDAPVDMGIEKIIVHEDYSNNKSYYNDIALIRFNRSVGMSDYISPVCLPIEEPKRSQDLVGLTGYTAGWSNTGDGNEKLKVRLNVTDSERCANLYGSHGIVLKDTQICTTGLGHQDPCLSGGSPFMKQHHFKNYKYLNYLYGISSFGPTSCRSSNMPDVYTNVAKYIDWIESKME